MAILIQQQTGCINVLETSRPIGEQVIISLSLNSTANPFKRGPGRDYIQTYDSTGNPAYKININGSLQYQDVGGSPASWGGTLDELNNKLNNEYFVAATGGGTGGDASAALQTIGNDHTIAKKIGYVLDIPSQGSPPPYTDLVELTQTIDGSTKSYPITNLAAETTVGLAQIFNDLQTDIYYAALSATKLYFIPTSDAEVDITEVSYEDGNEGVFSFTPPYVETIDVPTGALHQLVTLMQKQAQKLNKQSALLSTSVDNQQTIINEQINQTAELSQTNRYLKLKNVGISFDLTSNDDWVSFPVTFNGASALDLQFGGINNVYPSGQLCEDIDELVIELNAIQNNLTFAAGGATILRLIDNSNEAEDLENLMFSFTFEDLEYSPPYDVRFAESNLDAIEADLKAVKTNVSAIRQGTPVLEPALSFSYNGNAVKNLAINADNNGNTVPVGSFADIVIFATDNDVEYRLDGGIVFTPAKSNPRTKKDRTTTLENVNLDIFNIKGAAANSRYSLVINIYKL